MDVSDSLSGFLFTVRSFLIPRLVRLISEVFMVNINVGDRVVDKTTGKHGKVDSFIRPWGARYLPTVKARVVLDNGNIVDVEPHNLSKEEGYSQPKVDNVDINALDNPNDKAEYLTPAKRGRKKKADNPEDVMDDIVDSAT